MYVYIYFTYIYIYIYIYIAAALGPSQSTLLPHGPFPALGWLSRAFRPLSVSPPCHFTVLASRLFVAVPCFPVCRFSHRVVSKIQFSASRATPSCRLWNCPAAVGSRTGMTARNTRSVLVRVAEQTAAAAAAAVLCHQCRRVPAGTRTVHAWTRAYLRAQLHLRERGCA